jgi:hypothetical protein
MLRGSDETVETVRFVAFWDSESVEGKCVFVEDPP